MKFLKFLFIGLVLFAQCFGQSQSTLERKCPGNNPSPANSLVQIGKNGNITLIPCAGQTITVQNGWQLSNGNYKPFEIRNFPAGNTASLYLGYNINPGNTGIANTILGGYYNTLIPGFGSAVLTGSLNTFVGAGAGVNTTSGNFNVALGDVALGGNTTGTYNIGIGTSTGGWQKAGDGNVLIGWRAGAQLGGNPITPTTNSENTFLGFEAGYRAYNCQQCTLIGFNAGRDAIGTGNVMLGHRAGSNETGSNKLYIANSNTATPLIKGDFSTAILTINGQLVLTGKINIPGATPTAANDSCTANDVWFDDDYGYRCLTSGNIKRWSINTW